MMADAEPLRTVDIGGDEPGATGATGATGSGNTLGPDEPPKERTRDLARMEADLSQLYVNVGVMAGVIGGQTGDLAGTVVARRADLLAGSWIDLAERDQRVRTAIKRLLQGNAWSGVIFAHVAVALPIAAVAGVLPEPIAQKVMIGLMVQDPELYAVISAYVQQQQEAAAGSNGDTPRA
jgi:hypothetical protein